MCPKERSRESLLFLPFPSAVMKEVQERVRRFADSPVPIVVLGETGTGKEVCAHAIWELSGRDRPFVAVNCAAIPGELMESEVFGHVKGAFTGAVQAREGLMARAHGGVLFLDELAELSSAMQAKLLRAIESGEYRPVGSDQERHAELRLLAASSADLDRLAHQGRFRAELLHRLGAVRIALPPLRERTEDIGLLAREFLAQFEVRSRAPTPTAISDDALELLASGRWPGNVRQLRNVVEAAAAVAGDEPRVELGHVVPFFPTGQPELAAARSLPTLARAVFEAEGRLIFDALRRTRGNREAAARMLDVSEATLYRKLKELRDSGHASGLDTDLWGGGE